MIMKEGMKHVPDLIKKLGESLGEGEAILIVPASGKVFINIGKFEPKVTDTSGDAFTITTSSSVKCRTYILPDQADSLMSDLRKDE